MTTPVGQEQSISYGAYPYGYINGLQISNDGTTPHSIVNIGSGVTIDSTDTFQMINNGSIAVHTTFNGLNGLDTGTLAVSTVYALYLVSDPVTLQPIGGMLSLSLTAPLMPFSYSAFKLIGFVTTDSSGFILPGYWTAGNSSWRTFTYDAIQATAITAGTSTSYANVNLIHLVPLVNNAPVSIYTNFNANAAADVLGLQAGNATGDEVLVIAPVAGSTAHTATVSTVLAQTVAISTVPSPVVNYKVSAGAVAVDVAGYTFIV